MPRSSTGKSVSRAGATGGGRTYRGQVPVNWYVALVLIVLAGLASIVFARHEYQQGSVASTVPPVKGGTPWYAAIDFDVCGTQRAPLASNALDTAKQSFYTTGSGVITIAPKSTSDAGHNAVLGKFVSSYPGLTLTQTQLKLPSSTPAKSTKKGSSSTVKSVTYHNGQKCSSGTKYAGKAGRVVVTYWPNAFAAKQSPSTVQGDPATLRFSDDQLITVGFVPAGTKLPKPNGTIVNALVNASAGGATTPTPTSAPTSSTTVPPSSSTSTTPSSTSTTAPGSKSGSTSG